VTEALHPIAARRERLLLYLAVWLAFGTLLAAVIAFRGETAFVWAAVYAVPLAVLLGLQSLSCWWLVQVMPAEETPLARLVGTWVGAGFVLLAIWIAAALGWAWLLRITVPQALDDDMVNGLAPLLLFSGAAGLLVAVLGHYMLVAFERSTQAERRALELRVLARESELRSLRGQLDPHFLFNSLNSVAALIGSDAKAARRMCFLMAGFFRKSLGLGGKHSIALSEELSLAETFLAIEEVRFGERLRTRFDIADDVLTLSVPPLVLQPLVENAVHHGVAHLIEGGEVMVRARQRDGLLQLEVENPCDPDRPPSRGAGVGLQNVRSRIDALFGHRASVDVKAEERSFRVSILLPASQAGTG
jgi:two-component system sensor histidine kinase AlgZ